MNSNQTTLAPPRALIVDDDPSLRLPMRAALEQAGFSVSEADNGRTAVEIFQEEQPDLVLLDVVMPGMDGFETCEAIRALPTGRHTQILMVTGLDDLESIERAFAAGANAFEPKPVDWQLLGFKGRYMLRAGRAFRDADVNGLRLSKTQQVAKIGNWEIDYASSKFICSPEAARLLGFEEAGPGISYRDFFAHVAPEEQERVKQTIDTAVKQQNSVLLNYRVSTPNQGDRFILNQAEITYLDDGRPDLMLGALQDVTELKNAEDEIRRLAFYDTITGLANRALFHDRLEQEILEAERQGQRFALLLLDLDDFKRVNDRFGHDAGDLLLKKVARILKQCVRSTDTAARSPRRDNEPDIARLGGDEYTLLLPNIGDPENAAAVARRIVREISEIYNVFSRLTGRSYDVAVTTSVGVAVYPTDGADGGELLKNADAAMYQAKRAGKNDFRFFDQSLNQAAADRFELERDIARALEQGEFALYYQPKINIETRETASVEALIRWTHPDKGIIYPDLFIDIAEESGKIVDINKWVVREACRQLKEWRDAGSRPLSIAVNLSGYQFGSQDIVQTIRGAMDEYGISPDQLEVELTENVLLDETGAILSTLEEIKGLGIRISLDDFGTGYSSLSYLTSFQVDSLKIDKSFVMKSGDLNRTSRIIIRAIAAMGKSMNLKIIAEGVETEEQFALMKEYGIDEAQGYLFTRPVPAETVMKMITHGFL